MKQKLLSFILLCTFLIGFANAQNRQVSGRVTSQASGSPIQGASVAVQGTSTATQTDSNGQFKLLVADNATLVFSYVGFESQTKKVANAGTITVSLVENSQQLSEVLVTGAYGIKRSAASTGYSNQTIDNKTLTEAKVTNVVTGLASKVAGLQVNLLNNGVSPSTRVVLRGNRSLTGNNEAMIVVDGVTVPNSVLASLNPNDIQDVNVLKGANAAALYGSEGVNGVLIITTKKGTKGNNQISFGSTSSLETVSFLPKFQENFGNGYDLDTYVPDENTSWGPAFDGKPVVVGPTLDDGSEYILPYSNVKNEKKKFWNTGSTFQNDLSFSGGDDVSTYYLSVQDVNIKGITPKDKNRRSTGRFNATRQFNKLSTAFNTSYTFENPNTTSSGVYENLLNVPQNVPITQLKDWQNNPFAAPDGYFSGYYANPYWGIDNNRKNLRKETFVGNVEFKYEFTDWLTATYRLANYSENSNYKEYQQKFTYAKHDYDRPSNNPGSVTDRADHYRRINSDFILQANKKFGDFDLGLILGNNVRNDYTKYVQTAASALVVPGLYNVSNRVGEPTVASAYTQRRQIAFFGEFTAAYRNYLYLSVTGRQESVSVLNKDNRAYFYPGAALSFVATEAIQSWKDSEVLSFAKAYVSANKTGNVNLSPYNLETAFGVGTGFPFGNLPGFSVGNSFANPNLEPEFVKSYEGGIQLGFFRDRLNFEGTYSHSNATGQIVSIATSSAIGYTSAYVNAGTVINNTVELSLRGTPVKTADWTWNVGINYTHYDNKVTELYQGLNEIGLGGYSNSAYIYAVKGEAYPVIKTTAYLRDPEGRIVVDAKTGYAKQAPTLQSQGQTNAPTTIGFNTNIKYKNIAVGMQFDYRTGNVFYSRLGNTMDFTGLSAHSAEYDRLPYVIPNSSIETSPGVFEANTSVKTQDGGFDYWYGQYRNFQENYVKDATFLKLRELSVTYTVPASWLVGQKVVKRASFGLVGRNLFTWLPKENKFTDPEYNFSTGNAQGISDLIAPPTRIYGFNLNVTF